MNTITMQQAARVLTGKNPVIRIQRPAYSRADGCTFKGTDGRIYVDLSPALIGNGKLVDVLLHELAHVKLHADRYTPSDPGATPASVQTINPSPLQAAAMQQQEHEAETLAAQWLKLATWAGCETKPESRIVTLIYKSMR